MKWKIGNVDIDNQIVLAPMSGICDHPFRSIIKSMGCGLVETEMISEKSVIQLNEKTREMLQITEDEKPIALQLFGSDKEAFITASKYIEENTCTDIIDINMGCPVRKVAENGKAGSAFLKNPQKAYDIVKAVVDTVDIPVTVKIRSGWNKYSINAIEMAHVLEEAGASAVCVHPRTKEQRYEGTSDWSVIKDVKESIDIPVIGNGDIISCYDAKNMLDTTGCDAVMIGRGVLGNPWLVTECIDYLDNNMEPETVSYDKRMDVIKEHAKLLSDYTTKEVTLIKMRKHAAYYVKGLYGAVKIKQEIFKTDSVNELLDLLEAYFLTLKEYEENKG